MNCQRIQDSFIDYQDGQLAPDESAQIRSHLATCLACQREWAALQEITAKLGQLPAGETPSPRLRENFYAMLETHQREADAPSPFAIAKSRVDRFFAALLPARPSLQFAFTLALLATGLFVGAKYYAPRPAATEDLEAKRALADLNKKVDSMGQLVATSLLQQKSTSERLQAVLATMDLKSPDRQVLTDLVGTLALDSSVNVRLSAVEALTPHAHDDLVRAGLLSALPRESAPIVQVAMIELLAAVREPGAIPLFDEISRSENVDKSVREAARRALATLRTPAPAAPDQNANLNPRQPSLT
jgi:hypothetical protein